MLEYRYENKQQYTSIPTYIYNNIHKTFLQESFYSVVFLLKMKKNYNLCTKIFKLLTHIYMSRYICIAIILNYKTVVAKVAHLQCRPFAQQKKVRVDVRHNTYYMHAIT
jgi:hypothetical protein